MQQANEIRIGTLRRRAVFMTYESLDRIARLRPDEYLRRIELMHRTITQYDCASIRGNEATVSRGTSEVTLKRENGNKPWYYVTSNIE